MSRLVRRIKKKKVQPIKASNEVSQRQRFWHVEAVVRFLEGATAQSIATTSVRYQLARLIKERGADYNLFIDPEFGDSDDGVIVSDACVRIRKLTDAELVEYWELKNKYLNGMLKREESRRYYYMQWLYEQTKPAEDFEYGKDDI